MVASFDLGRTRDEATLAADHWQWRGARYPWPEGLKERTIYWFDDESYAPLQRYVGSLIKLVPT